MGSQTVVSPHRIRVVFTHDKENINKQELRQVQRLLGTSWSESEESQAFQRTMEELDRLVGLKNVKELIFEIYALLQVNRYRRSQGLKADHQVLHMIFKGNPGTGKTTVARIIGKLLREMGFLTKGHLLEVERADLVGEYIGHTAQKTREHVKRALGGVLFIDEAYSLARGGDKDFGREAIDTLVKAMEDHKNEFVLILAGYSREMEMFLHSNPGLPSRFPIQIQFADYDVGELLCIAEMMVEEREYKLSSSARERLKQHLYSKKNSPFTSFSNARHVRNIIEKSIRHQAVRLIGNSIPSREDLILISPEDLWLQEKDDLYDE